MTMRLDTEQTANGIHCTHPVLGDVATIVFSDGWQVKHTMSHRLPELSFDTLEAAEYYALAVACEIANDSTD